MYAEMSEILDTVVTMNNHTLPSFQWQTVYLCDQGSSKDTISGLTMNFEDISKASNSACIENDLFEWDTHCYSY